MRKKEMIGPLTISSAFCGPIGTFSLCQEVAKASRFVIQEYTGAKDKNDREIYEGDIVVEEFPDDESAIGEVMWSHREKRFFVGHRKEQNEGNGSVPWSAYGTITIIGNIFEDSELLGA
jgi:uncharacterized phage protein (TIGR01671 family)